MNCTDHDQPDCPRPVCVVKALQSDRDTLDAEIETATQEPLIVLKALKTAEAQREELKKQLEEVCTDCFCKTSEAGEIVLLCALHEKNFKLSLESLEKQVTDTAREHALVDAEAGKLREHVKTLRDVSSQLVDAVEDIKAAVIEISEEERTVKEVIDDEEFWKKVNDPLHAYDEWFKTRPKDLKARG